MVRRTLIVAAVCVSLLLTTELDAPYVLRAQKTASQHTPVNAYAKSMAEFQQRLKDYLKLRSEATAKLPDVSETGNPAKISAREQALAAAIAQARPTAKAGDVFGETSTYLARIVAEDWKSRSAADRKALFSELPAKIRLTVNTPYPTELPLISVPPGLLAKLPTLPEALEYRLLGRNLLLRDRDANLIVDILADVIPR